MSETEASSSNSETTAADSEAVDIVAEKMEEFAEPNSKRRKIASSGKGNEKKHKLEERLGGILCCAVCLDLPRAAVYQVSRIF